MIRGTHDASSDDTGDWFGLDRSTVVCRRGSHQARRLLRATGIEFAYPHLKAALSHARGRGESFDRIVRGDSNTPEGSDRRQPVQVSLPSVGQRFVQKPDERRQLLEQSLERAVEPRSCSKARGSFRAG